MSEQQTDQVAYGFIACAGVALLFIIGKKVFMIYIAKNKDRKMKM